jgi:hypothetical protein
MSFSKNISSKSPKSSPQVPAETPELNRPNLPVDPTPSPSTASETSADATDLSTELPIPPAGEVMQYRAIGLVRGRYIPSLEQFTQGSLLSTDSTLIDTVLLGRVMSLVKKHVDLSQDHLWVVYPRVGKEDNKLHLQIVGIWEPETLKSQDEPAESPPEPTEIPKDGYFSIRGDVIYQSTEDPHLIVKIKQAPRKQGDKPKFFKLKLQGSLADKMVGHFWELNVQRQGELLVIESGTDICELPKSKPIRKKFPPKKGSYPGSQKPIISKPIKDNKANTESHPPNLFRKPIPKPSKRQPPSGEG